MNSKLHLPILILTLTLVNAYAQEAPSAVDAERLSNLSEKLGDSISKLGDGVRSVNIDWKENPEVKEITSYPALKRAAAINAIVWQLKENDKKIFANTDNNHHQLAAMIITRIFSFNYIKGMIGATADEVGIKDYLDGEIADLNLTITNKIPYDFYLKSSRDRSNKIVYLYFTNKEFLSHFMGFLAEKTNPVMKISDKTSAMSLLETCAQNVELCENI